MSNSYKVLILLVAFFGLGISCASAANVVSFDPQTVEVYPGSSQDVRIVMDEVPEGISGLNITISILDPEIAEITAVSFPDWGQLPRSSTIPSSSVWIKVADLGDKVVSGDTNVLLGTITVTGKKAGTTDLGIPATKISADGGDLITPAVVTGNIRVLDNEDNEAPVINSISLSSTTPETGDSITVTVDVADNVGVSSVVASGVSLVNVGANIWKGSIVAEEGTHKVMVSASDAAGNVDIDESVSYTATTSDTEKPVIRSVSLSDPTPNTGVIITVSVEATDNVGVTSIVASGISLTKTGGSIWEGNIVAVEGTHTVSVTASDASGNAAVNESASYTATNVSPTTAEAEIHFSPDTLKLGSGGGWVTVYIELPEGYDVAGIDASSVLLNGAVSAVTDPKYDFVMMRANI